MTSTPVHLDARVSASLVRICEPEGGTLGTGAVVADDVVLTCDHVVAGADALQVVGADGVERAASVVADAALRAYDLALLRCPTLAAPPLPAAASEPPSRFWTKGYHYGDRGFAAAVPVGGEVRGRTSVRYADYALDYALALTGDAFERGMSGAPLLDAETGVVTGVVTAHMQGGETLRGSAVPLAAAAAVPSLARLLARNDQVVPRYGRHLNAAGVREACRRQAHAAVELLATRRVYLPAQFGERPALACALADFRASARRVLALVGPAGTGKSTLLAHLAAHDRDPVLLLRGGAIAAGEDGLRELAQRALDRLAPSACLGGCHATQLARASAPRVLILLDALNEAPVPMRAILDEWIPATIAWMRDLPVQLALTSRPEHWERVQGAFDRAWMFAASGTPLGVPVGDLDDGETATIWRRYDVDPAVAESEPILRHPLMLRMHWETRGADGGPSGARPAIDRLGLLDSFVRDKCARVADRVPGQPPVAVVRARLSTVARHTLAGGRHALGVVDYEACMTSRPEIGDELLREHVLFAAEDRVRFTFDEVAEYLEAEHVDLDAALAEVVGGRARRGVAERAAAPTGSVVYALLHLARKDPARCAAKLDQAIAAADPADFQPAFVVADALAGCDDPTRFLPQLERFVERTGRELAFVRWRLLARLALPVPAALALLRRTVPSVHYPGWRDKDRDRDDYPRDRDLDDALARIVARAPAEALPELVAWLPDETRLDGDEGSIGSVGGIALWRWRALWWDALLAALLPLPGSRADRLRDALCAEDPERALAAIRARAPYADEQELRHVLGCAIPLVRADPAVAAQVGRLLLQHVPGGPLRVETLELLFQLGDRSDEVLRALEESFARGAFGLDLFRGATAADLPRVLALVEARLEGGPPLAMSDVWSLGRYGGTPELERRVVALLGRVLDDGAAAEAVPQALEMKLHQIDPSHLEASGLLALVRRVLGQGGGSAHRCLIYFAGGHEDPARDAIAAEVRNLLFATPLAADDASLFVAQLVAHAPDDALPSLLATAGSRYGAPAVADDILRKLLMSTEFSDERRARLGEWLAAHAADVPQAGSYVARLATGATPREAARAALGFPAR